MLQTMVGFVAGAAGTGGAGTGRSAKKATATAASTTGTASHGQRRGRGTSQSTSSLDEEDGMRPVSPVACDNVVMVEPGIACGVAAGPTRLPLCTSGAGVGWAVKPRPAGSGTRPDTVCVVAELPCAVRAGYVP